MLKIPINNDEVDYDNNNTNWNDLHVNKRASVKFC